MSNGHHLRAPVISNGCQPGRTPTPSKRAAVSSVRIQFRRQSIAGSRSLEKLANKRSKRPKRPKMSKNVENKAESECNQQVRLIFWTYLIFALLVSVRK
jgi:hypothetical protein